MNQTGNNCRVSWQQAALDHLDALYGFAKMLTHSPSAADDLVQETYIHAVAHPGHLGPDSNLKGWLFMIMRNTWLQQLRHTRSGPEFVTLEDGNIERWIADTSLDPQVLYIRIWEREEVRSALGRLPVAGREIIVLHDIEGFSYKEISEILDCPIGTVMSRLARARAKLKRLLLRQQLQCSKRAI